MRFGNGAERALSAALLLLPACGREPAKVDPSSPLGGTPQSAAVTAAAPTAPVTQAPSAAGSAASPIGSPRFCPGDDRTGLPLATSTFSSRLPVDDARGELEGTNGICGDTWCEGSFEWFFYDLRGDNDKSEITMRVYDEHQGPKDADATKVVVRGPGYVGRVLAQKVVPSCTTPCKGFKTPPRWEPCLTLDLRCDLASPWSSGSEAWSKIFIDCGIALERAIREIHPE
jgi:hypothetical protein